MVGSAASFRPDPRDELTGAAPVDHSFPLSTTCYGAVSKFALRDPSATNSALRTSKLVPAMAQLMVKSQILESANSSKPFQLADLSVLIYKMGILKDTLLGSVVTFK